MVSLKYDENAKALYFKFSDSEVAETEPVNDSIFFDIAKDGSLAGIEVILPRDIPEESVRKLITLTKV